MKRASSMRARLGVALLALLIACGDNLLADPSFDLWCGSALCAPWEASGKVSRVGTWHPSDYGVSLSDGASLSQLMQHDPVKCIELEVIADVDASAAVTLELDFRDDGSSEYVQLLAESHWARLRYLVSAPTWYDKLRFILRKQGKGRAVLAQIKASASDECKGPALPLLQRPDGATCSAASECASALCVAAPARYAVGLSSGTTPDLACGTCADFRTCATDEVCGVAVDAIGARSACVKNAAGQLGAWCVADGECEAGLCLAAIPGTHATCAQCQSDAQCASGEVCGVSVLPTGAARACLAPPARGLGEICAQGTECTSGVCCNGACSECCAEQPCASGKLCSPGKPQWLTVLPSLCGEGAKSHPSGAACNADDDCRSLHCDVPKSQCFLRCDAESCGSVKDTDCGFVRKLAGVCR